MRVELLIQLSTFRSSNVILSAVRDAQASESIENEAKNDQDLHQSSENDWVPIEYFLYKLLPEEDAKTAKPPPGSPGLAPPRPGSPCSPRPLHPRNQGKKLCPAERLSQEVDAVGEPALCSE